MYSYMIFKNIDPQNHLFKVVKNIKFTNNFRLLYVKKKLTILLTISILNLYEKLGLV